ncbi:hypothetical protein L2D14_01585 [Thalassospiraceae bacterium LMO-JJ14]|nr:hypothetical protein L2D14_01585 [Thalassospiraceae bacterium LMO-JJ14]
MQQQYPHQGRVDQDGSETYDFEPGDLGDVMGAKELADAGIAHNYKINRVWDQSFEGTVDIVQTPNGEELANPRFTWSNLPEARPKR